MYHQIFAGVTQVIVGRESFALVPVLCLVDSALMVPSAVARTSAPGTARPRALQRLARRSHLPSRAVCGWVRHQRGAFLRLLSFSGGPQALGLGVHVIRRI